jgi:septum formation protein
VRSDRSLILASGSPRRRVLLRRAGFAFSVSRPDVDETPLPDEQARAVVQRLSLQKAAFAAAGESSGAVALGADTAVVLGDDALGKPADPDDAVRMLLALSGRSHAVITAFALVAAPDTTITHERVTTRVTFRRIEEGEAQAYAATGEPMDKAGGYGIQGHGWRFVTSLDGSFTNVMGLPMEAVTASLEAAGFEPSG